MANTRHEGDSYRRIEVITGERRRRWTAEEKARIVAESFEEGANISEVARRNGVARGQTVAERFARGLAITGRSVSEILDGTDRVLDGDGSLAARVAAYERALIAAALAEHRGNIAAVLNALKIPRRMLNEKMVRFNLDRTQFVDSGDE